MPGRYKGETGLWSTGSEPRRHGSVCHGKTTGTADKLIRVLKNWSSSLIALE